MLFKKDFFLGLKVLFEHIPFMLRMIPKKYFRYMFRDFLVFVLAVGAPIAVMIVLIARMVMSDAQYPSRSSRLSMPVLSYFLTQLLAYFKLIEPDYLTPEARELFARHENFGLIAMGHTHNPEQLRQQQRWYFNTGTWIPISEAVRESVASTVFLSFASPVRQTTKKFNAKRCSHSVVEGGRRQIGRSGKPRPREDVDRLLEPPRSTLTRFLERYPQCGWRGGCSPTWGFPGGAAEHFRQGIDAFERRLGPRSRLRFYGTQAPRSEWSAALLAKYRAYDPELGRWLSRDPIAEDGGANLYQYANSDPVRYDNTNGLEPQQQQQRYRWNPMTIWAVLEQFRKGSDFAVLVGGAPVLRSVIAGHTRAH